MILSTYIFELGINTIVNQFINNLDGLIIRIQNLLILYLFYHAYGHRAGCGGHHRPGEDPHRPG